MALSDIKVSLYNSSGNDNDYELIVDEFAGRLCMTIKGKDKEEPNEIYIECCFEDLERAWTAVKRY